MPTRRSATLFRDPRAASAWGREGEGDTVCSPGAGRVPRVRDQRDETGRLETRRRNRDFIFRAGLRGGPVRAGQGVRDPRRARPRFLRFSLFFYSSLFAFQQMIVSGQAAFGKFSWSVPDGSHVSREGSRSHDPERTHTHAHVYGEEGNKMRFGVAPRWA